MQKCWRIVPLVRKAARVLKIIGDDDPIFIYAHADSDGISGASIVVKLLTLLGKPFVLRFLKQLRSDILAEIAEQQSPFYAIFVDLGSGHLREIARYLKKACKVIVLDHHIPEEVKHLTFKLYHVNFRLVGLDGGEEFSSSAVAYTLARAFVAAFPELKETVREAITGALGDNQDVGEKRSLVGLNKIIAEEGKEWGLIEEKIDLIIPGRSTKPVFQALADIYIPLIPGISGSSEGAYKALVSAGVLSDDISATTVTWDDLDEEKKRKIFELLVQRAKAAGTASFEDISRMLLGTIYEYAKENKPVLRDLRELSTLLNATARIGNPSVGLRVLLGEERAVQEAEMMLKRYHYGLSQSMKFAHEKAEIRNGLLVLDGRGVVDEGLASTVASLLARTHKGVKLVVVLASSDKGFVKVSVRKPEGSTVGNVRTIIERAISGIKGASGGGHERAGGAFLPEDKVEAFLDRLRREL